MKTLNSRKHWHVVYTRSRAEKKVLESLGSKNIECFLPLQKKLRQWKDRKKWVEVPLMSGYCFVHINRKEYDTVLQDSNVVCYITFEGRAAVIPEEEIQALHTLCQQNDFDVHVTRDNFEPGRQVEIIEGPMVGLKGEMVEIRGKHKFAIRMEQINTSILVEVPCSALSLVPESTEINY